MPPSNSFLQQTRERVDNLLTSLLPKSDSTPIKLNSALNYVISNGGKRIRPSLTYAAGKLCKANIQNIDSIAMAIELVHTYSLVHDDLPAMDDDDLRRGKPTCHIKYDEATAILTGDALQSLAFEVIASDKNLKPASAIEAIKVLSQAIGYKGMIAGQALDLDAENNAIDLQQLETLHHHKTGALIAASIELGGIAGNADDALRQKLKEIGLYIGLAFQIQDDILDVEGKTEIIGKRQGSDIASNKSTFPALLGIDGAKFHMQKAYQRALDLLDNIIDPIELRCVIESLINREY